MSEEYTIRRLDFTDADDLRRLVDLQNAVYQGTHFFSEETFRFWYLDNPNGRVVSFNAFFKDEMVAHYALIPVRMSVEQRIVPGLLSMATVTHPAHRGKGLFKCLARESFEYARTVGYEFVIGVANANSYPGFIKYFDFQDAGRLEVLVGCSDQIHPGPAKTYKTYWDKESVAWRLGRKGRYYQKGLAAYGTKSVWLFRRAPFIHTFMGVLEPDLAGGLSLPVAKRILRPFNLYVGLGSNAREVGYRPVPKWIKHSPFHLIFLDLTGGRLPRMTHDNVFFQLMDFDVA